MRTSAIATVGPWALALLLWVVPPVGAATPEDLLKEAQQHEKAGALQRAVTTYTDFLKKHPDHTQVLEAHHRLGKCYEAQGLVQEAATHYKAVADSDKKQFRGRADAMYSLGKLHASLNNHEAAAAVFEKLLGEGAGLNEDEVLNLCAGWYAILKKYDDAAAKFNILKRRDNKDLAEQAAYKLVILWIKAEKLDRAVDAVKELGTAFASNKQLPELLLRIADAYRTQKKFDTTISLCEQLKTSFPKTVEAVAANYLLGIIYRDRGEFQKAANALDVVGKIPDPAARAIACDALAQAGEIYLKNLHDDAKALQRFESAANLARDADIDRERKQQLLDYCWFHLAEHHFTKKNWATALDYYTFMRNNGTRVNVAGRIQRCLAELNRGDPAETLSDQDTKTLEEAIKNNPGSKLAAECEIMIFNRKFAEAERRKTPAVDLAASYEGMLGKYPKEILKDQHLEAYIQAQVGLCYSTGSTKENLGKAVAAFKKVVAFDSSENNPYVQTALENIAIVAQRAGDKAEAAAATKELFERAKKKLEANPNDKAVETKTLDYLKTMVTRTDSPQMIEDSIALTKKLIEERGKLSELAREARYYLGELYYLNKQFPEAAKTFGEYVQIYGPKQDAAGDVEGGPWKPSSVDEKVHGVYDAAARIAHCWYLNHHTANMGRAYRWIVRNLPHQNRYMAEAQYWLALEQLGGKEAQVKEGKRKIAEALWKGVVSPSLDFDDPKYRQSLHFWVAGGEAYADVQQYVKAAILKSGELFSQAEAHELAAACFKQYLLIYPPPGDKGQPKGVRRPKNAPPPTPTEEMYSIARYALGREYIATKNSGKLIETFKPFLSGFRDDKFRVSALKLLAFHAGMAGNMEITADAYATLLDEYGENKLDAEGEPIPVKGSEMLRSNPKGWDGIRMPMPPGLDQGEMRFSLGFFHFKSEDWQRCARALAPFLDDAKLRDNKSRPKALYMLGQSYCKAHDYSSGSKVLMALIKEHPRFEAIEEAYVNTAKALAQIKAWPDLEQVCTMFIKEWPKSDRRSRIDLFLAMAQVGKGDRDRGMAFLKSLGSSDTYQDVVADANYHYAMALLAGNPRENARALEHLEKSVSAFPRETSCLEAGKCAMKLEKWQRAKELLDRAARDFPQADARVVAEARELLPTVQKELAKLKK